MLDTAERLDAEFAARIDDYVYVFQAAVQDKDVWIQEQFHVEKETFDYFLHDFKDQ